MILLWLLDICSNIFTKIHYIHYFLCWFSYFLIWMRHAAREPPPPILVIWRLLQLLAVWRVQVVGGGCAANAWFAEGSCFCRFLLALEVCLDRDWEEITREVQQKISENYVRFHRRFIKIPSKIDQNGGQERFKSDPGSKSVSGAQKWAKSYTFFQPFDATWAILGAILHPSGFRKGSKNQTFPQNST